MDGIDFDFARYVAYRRGMVEQRARDGAAYSYVGEHKVRRALVSARPVAIAIEGTTRLWRSSAKKQLLDGAVKTSDLNHPRVYAAGRRAAERLGLAPPPIYVANRDSDIDARALGTDDDACIVINERLLDRLTEPEVLALVGHELAHIQNNHIPYTTALYYLRHDAVFFVRWIVQPAIMALQAWSRRAEVTCDRGSLLVTGDLDATLASIVKVTTDQDVDVQRYLDDLPDEPGGVGKFGEYFRSHPLVPKRVRALRVFARSAYYNKVAGAEQTGDGLSAEDVDHQVAEILSVH